MTDREIRELALKVLDGRVFGTWNVQQDLWRLVFIPMFFMRKKDLRKWKHDKIAHAYGVLGEDRTTGQAVNGVPLFFSCRVLTERDFLALKLATNMAEKQRKRFLEGSA